MPVIPDGGNRYNSTNTQGTTQPFTPDPDAVITVPNGVTIINYPAAAAITLTRLNGALAAAGASVGDGLERDSDGGFWDYVSDIDLPVPAEFTSLGIDNMRS